MLPQKIRELKNNLRDLRKSQLQKSSMKIENLKLHRQLYDEIQRIPLNIVTVRKISFGFAKKQEIPNNITIKETIKSKDTIDNTLNIENHFKTKNGIDYQLQPLKDLQHPSSVNPNLLHRPSPTIVNPLAKSHILRDAINNRREIIKKEDLTDTDILITDDYDLKKTENNLPLIAEKVRRNIKNEKFKENNQIKVRETITYNNIYKSGGAGSTKLNARNRIISQMSPREKQMYLNASPGKKFSQDQFLRNSSPPPKEKNRDLLLGNKLFKDMCKTNNKNLIVIQFNDLVYSQAR